MKKLLLKIYKIFNFLNSLMSILPVEIKQELAAYFSNTVDPYKLEIEFRFSEYYHSSQHISDVRQSRQDRGQHHGVNFAAFHRLKTYAEKKNWKHEFISLIDYTQTVGEIKYRKSINQLTHEVSWNEKRLIKNYDHLSDYYIRLGVNTERELNFVPNFIESNKRTKYRDTFYINNLAKLDLTYVEMDTDINPQKGNYTIQHPLIAVAAKVVSLGAVVITFNRNHGLFHLRTGFMRPFHRDQMILPPMMNLNSCLDPIIVIHGRDWPQLLRRDGNLIFPTRLAGKGIESAIGVERFIAAHRGVENGRFHRRPRAGQRWQIDGRHPNGNPAPRTMPPHGDPVGISL